MFRRPPRSTRTDTRFPYTTLFRSRLPCGFARSPAVAIAPAGINRLRNLEWGIRPAQRGARAGDFVIAQWRTVTRFLALLARRAKTDPGAAAEHRTFVAFALRGLEYRQSIVQGKRGLVRVNTGWRLEHKKKNNK